MSIAFRFTQRRTRAQRAAACLVALALPLAACETMGPKTGIGAATGAAAGGLIGAAADGGRGEAIIAGVLLGGLLGGALGNALDQQDRLYMSEATQDGLEGSRTGYETEWHNPDSGHYGSVTPTRTWQTASGEYCREYQQTVTIGGRSEQAFGEACREPDGSWRVVR
jgi:surface antigen